MNPFQTWKQSDLDAHNARVEKGKEVGKPDRRLETIRTPIPVNTGGSAHPVTNTRQFTNLTIQPCTDEQKLNKLERAWLRQLRLTHPEENIGIQSFQLKIGDDCRYTPDFWTLDADGQLHFWECKGFMRDDALVKIKAAARKYRLFRFILVTKEKGQWVETAVKP